MNAVDEIRDAMGRGKRVWALVLCGQQIKMAPGGKVTGDDALLCWTFEGADKWRRVAYVETRFLKDLDVRTGEVKTCVQ